MFTFRAKNSQLKDQTMKNNTFLRKFIATAFMLVALSSQLALAANHSADIVINITGAIVENTVNIPNNTTSANIATAINNANVSVSTTMISATTGIKTITYA